MPSIEHMGGWPTAGQLLMLVLIVLCVAVGLFVGRAK